MIRAHASILFISTRSFWAALRSRLSWAKQGPGAAISPKLAPSIGSKTSPDLLDDPHSISPRTSKTCSESDDFSNLYLIWEVPLTHKHGSVADLSGKCRLKWPARRGRHSDGGYHEGPTRQVELPKLLFTHCHCRQSKESAGDKEAGTYSGSMDAAVRYGIRDGCIRQGD